MRNREYTRNNIIVFLLFLILLVLPKCGNVRAAETEDRISANAEGQTPPGQEEQFPEADNDQVVIRVEGHPEETDRQALLDRLNVIRAEACEEGVPNPVNGEALRPEDYVPLEWSGELEKIAMLRAVETTILQDHVRPDGSECFSAAPEGVAFTMETLAWGYGNAAAAVEGWYSEKAAYVGETGTPAGHYMALINPENRFVGIADFRPEWQRDACAGAFASHGEAGIDPEAGRDSAAQGGAALDDNEWNIPLLRSYLPEVIKKAVLVTARRIYSAARPGR